MENQILMSIESQNQVPTEQEYSDNQYQFTSLPLSPPNPPNAKEKNKNHFLLLGLLTLVGIFVIVLLKFFYLREKPEVVSKQRVDINDNEWRNIKNKLGESYLFRYFNHQLKQSPEIFSSKSNSPAEKFFVSAYKYANVPSEDIKNKVLGEEANAGLSERELETSLVKIRLSGAINNQQESKIDEYEIFITNLASEDTQNIAGISDILINGKIGNLQLGDPDFDALHLSIIEPNQSTAYIKASISDIFLITLDRIIYGPDPESTVSGVVSAEYDDIYPFFDRYIEIVSDESSKGTLPEEIQTYISEYSAFCRQSFHKTLGNFDAYLTIKESYNDVMAGESIIRVETNVNKLALFNQLKTFLTEINNYARERKEVYEKYCQNENEKAQQDCLNSFGYMPEEKNSDFILAFAPIVNFEKFDILLNSSDRSFSGVDLSISLNKSVFDLLKKTLIKESSGLTQIEDLNLQLAFRKMQPKKIATIEKPSFYLQFTPDGETKTVGTQIENDTEKLAYQLFLTNHNYVYEVWEKDLEKIGQNKKTYCQKKWNPNFCLEIGEDWEEDELSISAPDRIRFLYPSRYHGLKTKYLSLEFLNDQTITEGLPCNKSYKDYSDIQTKDGLMFRINLLDTSNSPTELLKDEFITEICYKNPDGKYTTISPLATEIILYAREMTFEEISQKVGAILETIKIQNPEQVDLNKEYSQAFKKYETFYLGRAKDDPNSCRVSFYRDKNSFSKTYENIKKDFSINEDFNDMVIEENTVYCNWSETIKDQKYCLKCVKGKLEWTELDDCKGLSCNP